MTKQASGAATPDAKPDTSNAAPAPGAGEAPLTRAEIAELVRSAVAEALKPAAAPATAPAPVAEATPAAVVNLSRQDISDVVAESLKPIKEQMEKLAGQTVVRSEGEPAAGEQTDAKDGKTKTKDVFRNSIPGLRVAKAA